MPVAMLKPCNTQENFQHDVDQRLQTMLGIVSILYKHEQEPKGKTSFEYGYYDHQN